LSQQLAVLDRMKLELPEIATLVDLVYVLGMSLPDAALKMKIAQRTAERRWQYGKAWLQREMCVIQQTE
jgi:DNA-directed RNA polymerase specialized sigma24 family protein